MKNLLTILTVLLFVSCQPKEAEQEKPLGKETEQKRTEQITTNNSLKRIQKVGDEPKPPSDFEKYQKESAEYEKKKDFKKIIEHWNEYRKSHPKSIDGYIYQAKAYSCLGKEKNALKLLVHCEKVYNEKLEVGNYNSHDIISLASTYLLLDKKENGKDMLSNYAQKFKDLRIFQRSYPTIEKEDFLGCK